MDELLIKFKEYIERLNQLELEVYKIKDGLIDLREDIKVRLMIRDVKDFAKSTESVKEKK